MSDESTKKQSSLVEFAIAFGAIFAIPLALFTFVNNIAQQTIISLIAAVLTGIVFTIWLIYTRKMNWAYLSVAWLLLIVIGLIWFAVWPDTMTIEGYVSGTNGDPVTNETVKFYDYRGQVYETQTDKDGFYQFVDVPTGKYRIRVQTTEIQGESRGVLVRVVSQSIIVSSESKEVVDVIPTDTPTQEKSKDDVPIDDVTDTPTPESTKTPTPTPELTDTPTPTDTPRPTPVPTATIDADPTVYDNFNNPAFDGEFNTGRWEKEMPWGDDCSIKQQNGTVIFSSSGSSSNRPLCILKANSIADTELKAIEANIYAEPGTTGEYTIGNIQFGSSLNTNEYWFAQCGIFQDKNEGWINAAMNVDTSNSESGGLFYYYDGIIVQDQWYKFRLEFRPDTMEVNCYINDTLFASHLPEQADALRNSEIDRILVGHWGENTQATYRFDDVRIFTP